MTVKELIGILSGLPEDMTITAAETGADDATDIFPVVRAVVVKAELEGGVYVLENPLDPSPKEEEILVIVS